MENAADALKMAAAILIFIIAIASSFSLFGTAKQTADSIIGMRDKQAYLEAAEEEVGGILYTSSSSIKGENVEDSEGDSITTEYVAGVTKNGDRIVSVSDVISTIYRYSKEKYGVTIVESSGTVKARYDSNTESVMSQWYNIIDNEETGKTAEDQKNDYIKKIKENIGTKYISSANIDLDLVSLYKISVTGNGTIECGAPWYGNDEEIQKRINADISGSTYKYNGQEYNADSANKKNLLETLSGKKIIEVTNEIDQSKYLSDTNEAGDTIETNLLQQYQMPTVEIIYIVYND